MKRKLIKRNKQFLSKMYRSSNLTIVEILAVRRFYTEKRMQDREENRYGSQPHFDSHLTRHFADGSKLVAMYSPRGRFLFYQFFNREELDESACRARIDTEFTALIGQFGDTLRTLANR
ncbi:hypothetical protein EDF88_3558 [Buttiauxella sp. BIGb0552]|uniref:hypothetical protein n=1 Tax=Buttiauxella sp. BIGb0552 TaxID=2485120 RepID=UPI0010658894|nr:hypothetical protein [Buttiauxella sp. BIGb0552]TDX15119.1 hypothetical protein EDF88_3558 [Buttiauxella sp. BIGb0552]